MAGIHRRRSRAPQTALPLQLAEGNGALGEQRAVYVRVEFVDIGRRLARSESFLTRSTTRASRTCAVAMSEPEAKISKAGVIMAAILTCAGENPPKAQPRVSYTMPGVAAPSSVVKSSLNSNAENLSECGS
jgi:hypothetical protein